MSADDYLALITSEHRHRPKFEAVVAGLAGPFVEMQMGLYTEDFILKSK